MNCGKSESCRELKVSVGFFVAMGLLFFSASGCSDMGYSGSGLELPEVDTSKMSPTSIGATTGAVLGAGLGTIVGSASGNVGEGLVLGSIAGAAAGGAVGYGMEETHDKIANQEKAIGEQQQTLERQKQEISDLKSQLDDRGGKDARSAKLHKRSSVQSKVSSNMKSDSGRHLVAKNSIANNSGDDDSWLDPKSLKSNSAGADAIDSPASIQHVAGAEGSDNDGGITEQAINVPNAEQPSVSTVDRHSSQVSTANFPSARKSEFPPARSSKSDKIAGNDVEWVDESHASSSSKLKDKKVQGRRANLASDEASAKTKRARLATDKESAPSKANKESLKKEKANEAEKEHVAKVKEDKKVAKLEKETTAKETVKHDSSASKTEDTKKKEQVNENPAKVSSSKGTELKEPVKSVEDKSAKPATTESEVASKTAVVKDDPACAKAEEEARRASGSKSAADKLFYYRRALRVCPSEAKYHYEIGRVYSVIGRNEDAIYELRQALDLNPGMSEAKAELNKVGGQ